MRSRLKWKKVILAPWHVWCSWITHLHHSSFFTHGCKVWLLWRANEAVTMQLFVHKIVFPGAITVASRFHNDCFPSLTTAKITLVGWGFLSIANSFPSRKVCKSCSLAMLSLLRTCSVLAANPCVDLPRKSSCIRVKQPRRWQLELAQCP